MRPKNLIGGDLADVGPCHLIKDLEQAAGVLAGLEGGTPEGRHAGDGLGPGHDPQESPGDAEADPLGLGDDGELGLLLGGDLEGELQPILEGLDFGMPLGEFSTKAVDSGLGRDAIDGLDDLLGLAIERLPRLIAVLGHPGKITVSTTEDGEGAGDPLREGGHGTHSVEDDRGITPTIAHVPTGIVHELHPIKEVLRKSPEFLSIESRKRRGNHCFRELRILLKFAKRRLFSSRFRDLISDMRIHQNTRGRRDHRKSVSWTRALTPRYAIIWRLNGICSEELGFERWEAGFSPTLRAGGLEGEQTASRDARRIFSPLSLLFLCQSPC